MKLFSTTILVIFLFYSFPAFSAASKNGLTKKQVLADLKQVEKLLKRIHPNIYTYNSKAQINRKFSSIRSSVRQKSSIWATAMLAHKMLAAVCDEHTGVDFGKLLKANKEVKKDNLNLPLIIVPKGVFFDNSSITNYQEQLVAINGVDVAKIKQHIFDMTAVDGCILNQTVFTNLQSQEAAITLGLFLGSPDKFKIESKTKFSTNLIKTTKPESKLKIGRYDFFRFDLAKERALIEAGFMISSNPFDATNAISQSSISLSIRKNKDIAYIQARNFVGDKQQRNITNRLMRDLIKANPKHVIIDLMENPGGRIKTASHFISYFLSTSHRVAKTLKARDRSLKRGRNFHWRSKKRKTTSLKFGRNFYKVKKRRGLYTLKIRKTSFGNPSYKGKLTILVSPRTRSAATITALILKRKRNAKIVGVTAGGSSITSCFAPNGTYELKFSGVHIKIPRVCYDRNTKKGEKTGHLEPDIKVSPLAVSSEFLSPLIISTALKSIDEMR